MYTNAIVNFIKEINDLEQLETFFEWQENESNHDRFVFSEDGYQTLLYAFTEAKERIEKMNS